MKFKTNYNYKYVPDKTEVNTGEILVESAGYRSNDIMIQEFLQAGVALNKSRQLAYDTYDVNQNDLANFDDPTRRPGFDPADASQIMLNVKKEAKRTKSSSTSDDKATQKPKNDGEKQKEVIPPHSNGAGDNLQK